jgi:hypothetical protein
MCLYLTGRCTAAMIWWPEVTTSFLGHIGCLRVDFEFAVSRRSMAMIRTEE